MTTVTITDRIMMIRVLKTAQFTLIFVGNGSYAVVPASAPALHKKLR